MIGGNHETASTLSAIEGRNNLRLFCDDYMGRVVCLCGDAMITVSHYLELADVSWCIADTIIGETRDDMALYFIGHAKPNYPVPATMKNADIACIYTALSVCQMETPCMTCIEKYMDCLAFEYPFLDD